MSLWYYTIYQAYVILDFVQILDKERVSAGFALFRTLQIRGSSWQCHIFVSTGCLKKKWCSVYFVNFSATKRWIFKLFFSLKTEIHTLILNTQPYLCGIRGPRYLQNEMLLWNRSIQIHSVSYRPQTHMIIVPLHAPGCKISSIAEIPKLDPSVAIW